VASSGQPLRDLYRPLQNLTLRHGAGLGEMLPECLAFQQLRDDERHASNAADVVHDENIGMIEGARSSGFGFEPLETAGIGSSRLGQHFDRNVAPEPRVARPLDDAHASRADADDLVRSQPCSRRDRMA
jgi:hypothetical protein